MDAPNRAGSDKPLLPNVFVRSPAGSSRGGRFPVIDVSGRLPFQSFSYLTELDYQTERALVLGPSLSPAKFARASERANADKEVLRKDIQAGNFRAVESFLHRHSILSPPSIKIIFARVLATEILALPEEDDPNGRISKAFFLLRLANRYGYDSLCMRAFDGIIQRIINNPYVISSLTKDILNDMEALMKVDEYWYPIAASLCGVYSDQWGALKRYHVMFHTVNYKIDKSTSDELASNLRMNFEEIKRRSKDSEALNVAEHFAWLLDEIETGFLANFPPRLRSAICVRLLFISKERTYFDLRMLDHLPLFLGEFSGRDPKSFLFLLTPWLTRCISMAGCPTQIPLRRRALERLYAAVQEVAMAGGFINSFRNLKYSWMTYLAVSTHDIHLCKALSMVEDECNSFYVHNKKFETIVRVIRIVSDFVNNAPIHHCKYSLTRLTLKQIDVITSELIRLSDHPKITISEIRGFISTVRDALLLYNGKDKKYAASVFYKLYREVLRYSQIPEFVNSSDHTWDEQSLGTLLEMLQNLSTDRLL